MARRVVGVACALLLMAGGTAAGMELRWFPAPYPPFGKELAWLLGMPEPAYNFGVVESGVLYRSGRPDQRFLRHLRDEYGIRRIVDLTGGGNSRGVARELGIERTAFTWDPHQVAPPDEFRAILDLADDGQPLLIHCAGGADRTGFAVAAYRVLRQGWPFEEALRETAHYRHEADGKRDLHRALRDSFEALSPRPPSAAGSAPY